MRVNTTLVTSVRLLRPRQCAQRLALPAPQRRAPALLPAAAGLLAEGCQRRWWSRFPGGGWPVAGRAVQRSPSCRLGHVNASAGRLDISKCLVGGNTSV